MLQLSYLYWYLTIEVLFYLLYRFYFRPNANDLTRKTIKPFRGYGRRRHLIFQRILDRMEKKCQLEKKDIGQELHSFLRAWFYDPPSSRTAADTPCCYPNDIFVNGVNSINGQDKQKQKSAPDQNYFCKEDLLEFFSWAFFDKKHKNLKENWEKEELDKMFDLLHSRYGFVYPMFSEMKSTETTTLSRMKPKSFTLEDCDPLHRPLALYAFFAMIRYIGYVILYCIGFRRYTISIPTITKEDQSEHHNNQDCQEDKFLSYWLLQEQTQPKLTDHRDTPSGIDTTANRTSCSDSNTQFEPTLFFHGIAPAGLTFYIPMLYNTVLLKKKQLEKQYKNPIFLFENLPITCSLVFDALTEEETMYGVEQALSRHGFSNTSYDMNSTTISSRSEDEPNNNNNNTNTGDKTERAKKEPKDQQITIIGHSFGSFQLTWLLNSQSMKQRIKKVILLDPVSIMLSESDVVANFVYCQIPRIDKVVIFDDESNAKIIDNKNDKSSSQSMSMMEYINRFKIRVFCSSEIGIGYYLRRHFAWYNSELWLDDILKSVDVSIYVSENDEILNAEKVVKEISRFPNVKLTYWKDVGHAAVISNKELWMDVAYDFMDERISSNINSSNSNTIASSSSVSMSRMCSSVSSVSSRSGITIGFNKDKLE